MNIEELRNKSNAVKNKFTNGMYIYSSTYDLLINQLIILAQENNGDLPNEFILSDNKNLFITIENILKIFDYLDLKIDTITNNISAYDRINRNIPETIYANEFYMLYYIKLTDK